MPLPLRPADPALETYYTVREVARICLREPKTIRNLIHAHKLITRYGYVPIPGRRMQRRIVLIPTQTAERLRSLTLLRGRK